MTFQNPFTRTLLGRRALLGTSLGVAVVAQLPTWSNSLARADASLLLNPGFEDVKDGWPQHWTPYLDSSVPFIKAGQAEVRSGDWAATLTNASGLSTGLRSNKIRVQPGEVFEGSAHVWIESGRVTFNIEFWDEAGQRISFKNISRDTQGTWLYVDCRAIAPEGAETVSILLHSPKNQTGTSHWDDARLEKVDPMQPRLLGPAALTAASRGAVVLGDRVYFSARYVVDGDKYRLGAINYNTGKLELVKDLPMNGAKGQKLATDGKYLYLGPAASEYVWRYDPATDELLPWAKVGPKTTWMYAMSADDEYLYVGTYPDCQVRSIRLSDAHVEVYGRVSTSQYASAALADDQYVYGGSAAPGKLLRWPKGGGEPVDLSKKLTSSPVGIIDMKKAGDHLYIANGRQVISMKPDGTDRVSHDIPEEDRYADQIAVAPDGTVYAMCRLTTNIYRVTETGLELVLKPLADVENTYFTVLEDGRLLGVTGLGHVWIGEPGGEATVWDPAGMGYGYPDEVQSILLHSNGTVWTPSHYALTVHDVKAGTQRRAYLMGEAKAIVEAGDGSVYVALYPSASVAKINPNTLDVQIIGYIGMNQMRPMDMQYDNQRDQLIVATGGKNGTHQGALTFIDLKTGNFDVKTANIMPEERAMCLAIVGDTLYVGTDTYGDSTGGPKAECGHLLKMNLDSKKIEWNRKVMPTWHSYEQIVPVDGKLMMIARRISGEWIVYDPDTDEITRRGKDEGYGGMEVYDGRVYTWNKWSNQIRELPTETTPDARLIHDEVPNGWYNNPFFAFANNGHDTWGTWGSQLALIPLQESRPQEPPVEPADPEETPTESANPDEAPTDPAEPSNPTQPVDPQGPSQPATPADPDMENASPTESLSPKPDRRPGAGTWKAVESSAPKPGLPQTGINLKQK